MSDSSITGLLRGLFDAAPPETDALAAWWQATSVRRGGFAAPVDRAIFGGACADRLGFAFAGGYAEALRALVPGLEGIAALCATEEGGAHPRAIATMLAGGRLTGRKKWATFATHASTLLVVASTGADPAGRNRLRVVRVAADAAGVRLHPTSAPFVPEIPHAEVELHGVAVADADVLPGDGYDDYLKPFRTIEDAHVHAALAGYLFGVAKRRGWRELVECALALVVAARGVARVDPKDPSAHVALAGVLALASHTVSDFEARWSEAPDEEWERWRRDRPLLGVARGARAARLERAWSQLGAR